LICLLTLDLFLPLKLVFEAPPCTIHGLGH
jgi:hypothetical protein